MKILLNPFSVELEKKPFMSIENEKPIFSFNDFYVYKYSKEHFVHTFKNIVIAERTMENRQLILSVANDIKPEKNEYHDYERPKEAMLNGIKYAKKLNFIID